MNNYVPSTLNTTLQQFRWRRECYYFEGVTTIPTFEYYKSEIFIGN